MKKLIIATVLLFSLPPAIADDTTCKYVSSGGGSYHTTLQPDSMAIICSDGTLTSLITPAPTPEPAPDDKPETLPVPWSGYAQLGDVFSTAAFLSLGGGAEGNAIIAGLTEGPAGFVGLTALKLGLLTVARRQDQPTCTKIVHMLKFFGSGATANNLAAWAGGLAIKEALAIGIGAGVLFGYLTRDSSRAECQEGVPSFLVTARVQSRIEQAFGMGR